MVPGKTWFTERHHRETPYRIEHGQADVGIVWTTEVRYAKATGRKIDGVAIPDPSNMRHKVAYAIGPLTMAKNAANAFLRYLANDEAQAIYEKHGFIRATPEELTIKPL